MEFMTICENLGVLVGALAGSIASSRVRMDLFGVVTCGSICALGGGTVRDLLLGHDMYGNTIPVYWTVPSGLPYLYVALITSFVVFFVVRKWRPPMGTIRVMDALTVALFTMIGTQKSYDAGFPSVICVLMGLCTGVAGGILRDLATGNVPYVFRPGELYATAALVGSIGFLFCKYWEVPSTYAFVIGFFLVSIVRFGAIAWRWSLPSYQSLFDSSEKNDEG